MKAKAKALIGLALAATFASASALADKQVFYSAASEENPIRDTLDMRTGGFKGWGPQPNPVSAVSDRESTVQRDQDLLAERARHLHDVQAARERVWVANAPLRSDYDNIGASSSRGGSGVVEFFQRGAGNEEILETK